MTCRNGFSLVELSIVLVILGLLTGGILAGQSLVRAAEIRGVTSDISKFNVAVYAFRDKYFMLPGDLTNATKFWGQLDPDPVECYKIQATDARTCDGDGDGTMQANVWGGSTYYSENFRAWQHLANAGLITGQYTGRACTVAAGSNCAYIGVNVPMGRIANSGYSFLYLPRQTWQNVAAAYFVGDYGNTIQIGTRANLTDGPFVKPEEAWNVDTKIDDGKPGLGKLVVRHGPVPQDACSTDYIAASALYNLISPDVNCSLIMRAGF